MVVMVDKNISREVMRFDPTINLGHILTIVALMAGGIAVWTAFQTKIAEIYSRTEDYPRIRDLTLANDIQIQSLRPLILSNTETNRRILETLGDLRSDMSALRASLDERGGEARRGQTPANPQ